MDNNTAEAELAKERHRNLDIWKRAVALTARICELTRTFPRAEIFGLTNQLRRASCFGWTWNRPSAEPLSELSI